MKTIKYIFFISLFIHLIACKKKEKNNELADNKLSTEFSISKAQFKAGNMKIINIQKQIFDETVECTGLIDVPPQNKAVISAVMGGYVKNSTLMLGDKVKKGQLILTIENPEYAEIQQQYLETKASIIFLEDDFERQNKLQEEKINSSKEFLKSKSEYQKELAKLEGLAEKLRMLSIRPESITANKISSKVNLYAPISGTVTMVNTSIGTYVDPSQPLMEIISQNHLHLELNVFEKDYIKIKKGQKIKFFVNESSHQMFDAEVLLVSNAIDNESRMLKIYGKILNDNVNFALGMYIQAQIIIGTEEFLAIPNDAIAKFENGNALVRLLETNDNSYVFATDSVVLGKSYKGKTAIINYPNYSADNKFLEGGYYFLNHE